MARTRWIVQPSKDWVAVIVAVGLSTALNVITAAVLFYAFYNHNHNLSDNAVQLLTGWGGGMIGIVGAYIGYRASPIITPPQHEAGEEPETETGDDTPTTKKDTDHGENGTIQRPGGSE
jgi:hypothetical protein